MEASSCRDLVEVGEFDLPVLLNASESCDPTIELSGHGGPLLCPPSNKLRPTPPLVITCSLLKARVEMGKRDIGATNGAAEDGGHRLKRRKESGHVQDLAQDASGQGVQNGMVVGGGNRAESVESVREQGLQWYQVLKDATDKT